MANVGHCVVITAELLVEATNKLKELGQHDLAKKLIANHKPLKPIVKDAYFKKEFPKYKPKNKGVYITDYDAQFDRTSTWDGDYFINFSGGIIDKEITWFLENLNETVI
jgi:hypothetical protein